MERSQGSPLLFSSGVIKYMKWEYNYQFGYLTDSELNEFGMDGWELVSFCYGISDSLNKAYIFKRPLLPTQSQE